MGNYVVYVLANKRYGTLYFGVTNNLKRRIIEHRYKIISGFTEKYGLNLLVHFEQFEYIDDAIHREKQLKRWLRDWKINLIEKNNPMWVDLYEDVFGEVDEEYVNYILKQHNYKN